jgi:ABC-type cobalamin transport system permease subunit
MASELSIHHVCIVRFNSLGSLGGLVVWNLRLNDSLAIGQFIVWMFGSFRLSDTTSSREEKQ